MKFRHWSLLLWLILLVGVFSTGIFTGGGLAGIISSPQVKPTPAHPDPGPQPYPDAYKVQSGKLRNIAVPGNHGDIPYPCGTIAANPPFTGVSPLSIACIPNTPDWGYGDLAVWQANGHSYAAQSGFEYRMYYIWNVDDPYNPVLLYNKPFPSGGSASTAIFHFHQFNHEYMATTMRGTGTGCGYFIDNIDNPANPVPVVVAKRGTDWCTPHETFVSTNANGDADYAWLTMSSEGGSGIKIIVLTLPDLSQPNPQPVETGRYQRPDSVGFAHDSNVVGNHVFIAHWDGGVIVEDKETLAHSTNPTPLNPINSIRPSNFWVHHMVPTTDGKFLFAEDEFLNGSGVQKIKYYDIQDLSNPVFLGGITGGDPNSEMSQAHNQIIKNLGPHHDLLLSAWYLAGYRLFDIDSSGSSPVVTQVGGHQLRATGGPDFGGVWGVDSLPCTVRGVETTCIYSSDMQYGLVVDALGVNPAFDPYLPDPAVITSPTEGQQINACSFTITGTAPQDYWSGLARVEVSVDNGATWNTATGTTNWSYQWNIVGYGPYTIMARAVDNAGNVQSVPTQVHVTVMITCGEVTNTPTSTATSTSQPPTATATPRTPSPTTTPACMGADNSPLCTPPPTPATSTPTTTATPTVTSTSGPPVATPTIEPTVCTIEFTDVPPGSTFYSYIHCLACLGIISGYPCGGPGEPCNGNGDPYFRPASNVTRGQIAKIVSNAAHFNEPIPWYQQTFEDVPAGNIMIERLAAHGAIAGYPCGGPGEPCVAPENRPYFRPNNNATRAQLSKVIAVAADLSDPLPPQIFEDVPPTNTFYQYIQRLAGHGFMGGYACGGPGEPCVAPGNRPYFRPNRNASRGQTSKIVANTFLPSCSLIR